MKKLALLLAFVSAGLTVAPPAADACGRFGFCRVVRRGAVRVAVPPFAVRIGWPPAHIMIRGPIIGYGVVAETVPEPPPPPVYEPPPQPVYEPPPAPAYEPPPPPPAPPMPPAYGAPVQTVAAAARPREPSIGVGVRGSALRIGRDGPEASGIGALLRFRARPVEIEFEIGRDHYQDIGRNDTRLGANLLVPLTSTKLQPFLLVGAGMNFASFDSTGDELHQGYLAGGGGLSLRLGQRLAIAADARYMLRRFFDSEDAVAAQGVFVTRDEPTGMRDQAAEVRLNALLYF